MEGTEHSESAGWRRAVCKDVQVGVESEAASTRGCQRKHGSRMRVHVRAENVKHKGACKRSRIGL